MKTINFGLPQITFSFGGKCLDFHILMSRLMTTLALVGTGGALAHLIPVSYVATIDIVVAVYNALVPSVLTPAGLTRDIIPTTNDTTANDIKPKPSDIKPKLAVQDTPSLEEPAPTPEPSNTKKDFTW